MRRKYERCGLSLELTGLILLLIATYWEAEFTSWWDNSSVELQHLIQEEANLAILGSLANLSKTAYIEDYDLRKSIATRASEESRDAAFKILQMRENRLKTLEGQPKLFATIRKYLLIGGAALILIGKAVFLRSYWARKGKPDKQASSEAPES